MTKRTIFRLVFAGIFTIGMTACSTNNSLKQQRVDSPLGLFRFHNESTFWIAVRENNEYLVCNQNHCDTNRYERVPANYGVILLDFFNSPIGLEIESYFHGVQVSDKYINFMRQIRTNSFRPNDLAFNIGFCGESPCVGLGHRGAGVKFIKINSNEKIDNEILSNIYALDSTKN